MQKAKLNIFFLIFLLIIIGAAVTAFSIFYQEYTMRSEALEKQTQNVQDKVKDLEKELYLFKSTVQKLEYKFTKYDDALFAFEQKIKSDRDSIKEITAKIDGLNGQMKDWQKDYVKALLDTTEKVETIKEDLTKIDGQVISSLQADIDTIRGEIRAAQVDGILGAYQKRKEIEKSVKGAPAAVPQNVTAQAASTP